MPQVDDRQQIPASVVSTPSAAPVAPPPPANPLVQQLISQADSLNAVSRSVESQMKREGIPVLAATRDFVEMASRFAAPDVSSGRNGNGHSLDPGRRSLSTNGTLLVDEPPVRPTVYPVKSEPIDDRTEPRAFLNDRDAVDRPNVARFIDPPKPARERALDPAPFNLDVAPFPSLSSDAPLSERPLDPPARPDRQEAPDYFDLPATRDLAALLPDLTPSVDPEMETLQAVPPAIEPLAFVPSTPEPVFEPVAFAPSPSLVEPPVEPVAFAPSMPEHIDEPVAFAPSMAEPTIEPIAFAPLMPEPAVERVAFAPSTAEPLDEPVVFASPTAEPIDDEHFSFAPSLAKPAVEPWAFAPSTPEPLDEPAGDDPAAFAPSIADRLDEHFAFARPIPEPTVEPVAFVSEPIEEPVPFAQSIAEPLDDEPVAFARSTVDRLDEHFAFTPSMPEPAVEPVAFTPSMAEPAVEPVAFAPSTAEPLDDEPAAFATSIADRLDEHFAFARPIPEPAVELVAEHLDEPAAIAPSTAEHLDEPAAFTPSMAESYQPETSDPETYDVVDFGRLARHDFDADDAPGLSLIDDPSLIDAIAMPFGAHTVSDDTVAQQLNARPVFDEEPSTPVMDDAVTAFDAGPMVDDVVPSYDAHPMVDDAVTAFDAHPMVDDAVTAFDAHPMVDDAAPFDGRAMVDYETAEPFAAQPSIDEVAVSSFTEEPLEDAPFAIPFASLPTAPDTVMAEWSEPKSFHANDHARAYDMDRPVRGEAFVPEAYEPSRVIEASGTEAKPAPLKSTYIEISAATAKNAPLDDVLNSISDQYRDRVQALSNDLHVAEQHADAALEPDVPPTPVVRGIPGQIASPYMVTVSDNLEIPKVPPYIWSAPEQPWDCVEAGVDPLSSWFNCTGNQFQLAFDI